MSEFFAYICAKQSNDPFVPPMPRDLTSFARDVSDGFFAMQGGYLTVGRIALFPLQQSIPFHLLCDGKEVPRDAYPELFGYLGLSQGTPVDPLNFLLPNYVGAFAPAAVAVPEIVTPSTATSGTSTPGGGVGGSTGGQVDTGGRPRDFR